MQIVGGPSNDGWPSRALLWQDNTLTELPHIREAFTLLINDQGTIAGTRFLAGGSDRSMSAFETDVSGSFFIERPLPPGTSRAIALTESGILLIRTEVSGSTVNGYFALYRSQLYDLRQFFAIPGPDAIRAINDAGTIAGETGAQTAFLKGLDGAFSAPWSEYGSADALGTGGHMAGYGWNGHTWTLNIKQPDGVVARTPVVEKTSWGMHINRSGTVVGSHLVVPRTAPAQQPVGFVYRDGQLVDLNTLVPLPTERVSHAIGITDSGAILAFTSFPGWFITNRNILLVPAAPLPPRLISYGVAGGIVFMSWQASAGATDYVIEAGSRSGASDLYRSSIGSRTSFTAPAPSGRYFVRVRAQSGDALSAPSSEVVIDVP